jgi:hypothetical protein
VKRVGLLLLALVAGCSGSDESPGWTGSQCGQTPETADVEHVPSAGAGHVKQGSAIEWAHNPPTSGPHYPRWAPPGEYDRVIARGYWVHDLEHGYLVLLYRPDADPAAVEGLREAMRTLPADSCAETRVVMTPDPLLDTPVAAVTWNHALEGDHLDPAAVRGMFALCRNEAPEYTLCAEGDAP